jgi:hypothetical protein
VSDALEVGRGLSALWLRAVVGLLGAAITADLALAGVPALACGIAAVLALLCPLLPASPVPLLLIVLAAATAALSAAEPFSAAVLVLVPLAHALHLASGFAAVLPAGSRISPAAFRAPLRRAAAIQLAVGLMAVGAAVLPAGRTAPGVELVALLSSAVMALAVILLERSRS